MYRNVNYMRCVYIVNDNLYYIFLRDHLELGCESVPAILLKAIIKNSVDRHDAADVVA